MSEPYINSQAEIMRRMHRKHMERRAAMENRVAPHKNAHEILHTDGVTNDYLESLSDRVRERFIEWQQRIASRIDG